MADSLETITIEIESSSKSASNNIKKLADSLTALQNALGGAGFSKLQEVASGLKTISSLSGVKISKTIASGIKDIAAAAKEITPDSIENLRRFTSALSGLSGVDMQGVRGVFQAIRGRTVNVGSFETRPLDPNDRGNEPDSSQQVEDRSDRYERMASALRRVATAFRSVASAAKNAAAGVARFVGHRLGDYFSKLADPIKSATGKLGTFFSSLKRIAMYRLLRTIIKEVTKAFVDGVNNVYQWSKALNNAGANNFAKNMDEAATSILYFKNSIGAAVAPILNALIPALNAIVDAVVTVINWLNQLFALLSGASVWTRAKRKATEYAEAATGAGKASKDALRYLLPFDELNVLPDDKNRGGGGGGAANGWEDAFEDVALDKKLNDFMVQFKEALRNGDWYGAGEILAEGLNKMIAPIDVRSFGEMLGTKIEQGVSFALGFMRAFDFSQVGSKIAEGLNGMLASIDFYDVGALFVRMKTFIVDTLIGFFETLDWKTVGKSIGDFLRGVFDETAEWIRNYDWYGLGFKLYNKVDEFISGIDFASLASSFFTFLGNAFAAAVLGIAGFFTGVWDDLRSYFSSKTKECGGDAWEGFKKGIKDAIVGIGTWIKTNVIDPFVGAFKNLLGIHSPSTVFEGIGKDIIAGLKEGISQAWSAITTFFENAWQNLLSWWQGLKLPSLQAEPTNFEVTYSSTGNEFSGGGRDLNSIEEKFKSKAKRVAGTFASGGFPEDGLFFANHGELVGKFANGRTAVANNDQIVSGIAQGVEEANEPVVNAIMTAASQIISHMGKNGVSMDDLARNVTKWQNRNARAMGY